MGKFDGILFVTDLDGTLLNDDKKISKENKQAIKYFEDEGGLFTFITGRIPFGTRMILEQFVPKIPFGCMNGGGIYDYSEKKLLWCKTLPKSAFEIVEFVDKNFPDMGIELTSAERSFFHRKNVYTEEHRLMELFDDIKCHYSEIKEDIVKIIFIDEASKMPALISAIQKHPKFSEFYFVASDPKYYELLPKDSNKGNLLIKMAELLGVDIKRTISVGDNDNDVLMLKTAGVGFAVSNASDKAKQAADFITVSNEEHAIAKIIDDLEKGKFKI